MSSDKVWWYAKGGHRFGPHSAAELKALAGSGQLAASDMVWKEGLENWMQASSVKGLITAPGGSTPPPLPPIVAPPPIAAQEKRKMYPVTKVALWIGGIFFGLIVLGAIVGTDEKDKATTAQQASSAAPESSPPAVKVGDSFQTPTFEIQIRSAQARSSVGDPLFASQPSEGGIYIAIQWSYKNISQKPVSAFRRPTVHLKAPDGTRYDPDLGASASYATELDIDAKAFSDLNPGIRVVDADVFEVSRQMFDPSSWRILVDSDRDAEVEFVVAKK